MGLGPGIVKVAENWKPKKGRKKKDGAEEEESGCWVKLMFVGGCIPSRSKVDSSMSGATTHHCGTLFLLLLSISLQRLTMFISTKDAFLWKSRNHPLKKFFKSLLYLCALSIRKLSTFGVKGLFGFFLLLLGRIFLG